MAARTPQREDTAPQREDTQQQNGCDPGERPIASYSALTALFGGLTGGFALWMRRSGRTLAERPAAGDLLLITLATHKLSRMIAKDRVTSAVRHPFTEYEGEGGPGEVEERAVGTGLRRAVGELLICPFCLGLWVAAGFTAALAVAPRPARWVAGVFASVFGADLLQIAYRKLEDQL